MVIQSINAFNQVQKQMKTFFFITSNIILHHNIQLARSLSLKIIDSKLNTKNPNKTVDYHFFFFTNVNNIVIYKNEFYYSSATSCSY